MHDESNPIEEFHPPSRWTTGQVLSEAFPLFREQVGLILAVMVAVAGATILAQGPGWITQVLLEQSSDDMSSVVAVFLIFGSNLAGFLVGGATSLILAILGLRLIRQQPTVFGDTLQFAPHYLSALGASFLFGAACFTGTMLCIIPGIVAAIGLNFWSYALIDQRLGAIDSLKESWRLTHGDKLSLLWWMVVVGGLNVVGAMACLVGLLVTIPVTVLGNALIYDNLVKRKGRAGAF